MGLSPTVTLSRSLCIPFVFRAPLSRPTRMEYGRIIGMLSHMETYNGIYGKGTKIERAYNG